MKKLLDIIKLQQLNECYQLELDFKTQRRSLKRFLKSLKQLKTRTKTNHQYFAKLVSESFEIVQDQGTIKKKNSQMDYYLINGVKAFKSFNSEGKKLETFYQNLHNQVKDTLDKAIKYLDQSKEGFIKVSKEHEKFVKEYAETCFPQTATILYMIGFINNDKIKKLDNLMKEQCLLKETEMYNKILATYLQQMENLKKEMEGLFKTFYVELSGIWVECMGNMVGQIKTYSINETEIEAYLQETGGATTDRSDRSSKSDKRREDQI